MERVEDAAGEEVFLVGIGLVVGLDERDDSGVGRLGEPGERGGKAATLGRPRHVDDQECRSLGGIGRRLGVEGVGALHHADARIVAEFPGERAVARVEGEDESCAVAEEAVGEAADVAAEVGADEAGGVEVEFAQRVGEFQSAAADVGIDGVGCGLIGRVVGAVWHCPARLDRSW